MHQMLAAKAAVRNHNGWSMVSDSVMLDVLPDGSVIAAPDTAYIEGAALTDGPKGPLFRTIGRGTGLLTRTPLPQANAPP
jgi:hypothetical protein